MKKTISFLLVLVLFTSLFVSPVFAYKEISVYVNGKRLELDVPPQIIDGRTMVPMRAIFEELGASVYWNAEKKSIYAIKMDTEVFMGIDTTMFVVNKQTLPLDVPPTIIDGRTLVPIRAVSESFDAQVNWVSSTRTVYIDIPRVFEDLAAFDFLANWVLENGDVYADHVYINWKLRDNGEYFEIKYYPSDGNIAFAYYTPEDDVLAMIFLYPLYYGNTRVKIGASYISGSKTSRVSGSIDVHNHTDNTPISYDVCKPGEWITDYNVLEFTRQRINLMLIMANTMLTLNYTGVRTNTLGFYNFDKTGDQLCLKQLNSHPETGVPSRLSGPTKTERRSARVLLRPQNAKLN